MVAAKAKAATSSSNPSATSRKSSPPPPLPTRTSSTSSSSLTTDLAAGEPRRAMWGSKAAAHNSDLQLQMKAPRRRTMLLPWKGFLVCAPSSGWSKEGASSTPRSWLSLSATWRSRESSGTSLACAMMLAFIRQKLVY